MSAKDGGSAFPEVFSTFDAERGTLTDVYSAGGMSLRAHFAAHANIEWGHARACARQACGPDHTTEQVIEARASLSVAYADALLIELERQQCQQTS